MTNEMEARVAALEAAHGAMLRSTLVVVERTVLGFEIARALSDEQMAVVCGDITDRLRDEGLLRRDADPAVIEAFATRFEALSRRYKQQALDRVERARRARKATGGHRLPKPGLR